MSRVNIEGGRITGIDVLETLAGSRFVNRSRTTGVYTAVSDLRHELRWVAGERGKPGVNGDILSTDVALPPIADKDFEISGNGGTSVLCTHNVGGGIRLTTAGSDGNEMILVPHLDANQSGWDDMTGDTSAEVHWETMIRTKNDLVTNTIIWAGLKLTNADKFF